MRGHWIKMLGAVIALLPLAGYAGQGLEGGWQGTLDVGLVKFRVALEIQKDGQGQYWAFFNNIDDGIYHAKVSPLSIKGSSFHGQCPAGEVLDLKLNGNHDRLEGSYRQAGGSFQKPGKVSHLALGRGMDYLVPRLDVKGKPVRKFAYHIPEAGSDGWETGDLWNSVADIGAIETGIRKILNGTYPRIHGLCVVHQGKLILDEYFYGYGPDTPHPVQSITKSVFSLLFGIAVDQGRLKPEDKLYDFFPEYRKKPGWEDGKDKITLQTLLTMTSGLGCDDLKDSKSCSWGMVDSPDWLNFTLSLPLSQEPGKRFAYCGACLTPLSAVLAKKSGMSLPAFAGKYLWEPLGIRQASWVQGPRGITPVSFGLELRPRDLAKIGYLVLKGGAWNDRQVVSEKWVRMTTDIQIPRDRTNGKADYGFLWWQNHAPVKGKDIKMVYAWGVGGQYLWVVPELDLVCVMTGGNYKSGALGANALKLFKENILAAF